MESIYTQTSLMICFATILKPRTHWLFTLSTEKWIFSNFPRVGDRSGLLILLYCVFFSIFSDNKSELFFMLESKSSVGKCLIMCEDSCYVRLKTFRSCNREINRTILVLLYMSVGSRSSSVGSIYNCLRARSWSIEL